MINFHFRFDLFIPLHRLWLGYMSELLGLASPPSTTASTTASAMPPAAAMHAKLVKADFHGCLITGASLEICWNCSLTSSVHFLYSQTKQEYMPCWTIRYCRPRIGKCFQSHHKKGSTQTFVRPSYPVRSCH